MASEMESVMGARRGLLCSVLVIIIIIIILLLLFRLHKLVRVT